MHTCNKNLYQHVYPLEIKKYIINFNKIELLFKVKNSVFLPTS